MPTQDTPSNLDVLLAVTAQETDQALVIEIGNAAVSILKHRRQEAQDLLMPSGPIPSCVTNEDIVALGIGSHDAGGIGFYLSYANPAAHGPNKVAMLVGLVENRAAAIDAAATILAALFINGGGNLENVKPILMPEIPQIVPPLPPAIAARLLAKMVSASDDAEDLQHAIADKQPSEQTIEEKALAMIRENRTPAEELRAPQGPISRNVTRHDLVFIGLSAEGSALTPILVYRSADACCQAVGRAAVDQADAEMLTVAFYAAVLLNERDLAAHALN